jgi:hypothetical protein
VLEIASFVMSGNAFALKHSSKVPSKLLSLIVWFTETKYFGLLVLFYRFPFMGLKIPGSFKVPGRETCKYRLIIVVELVHLKGAFT